jgi:hypothetical protein
MIEENVNGEFVNFRDPGGLSKKLIEFYRVNRNEQALSEDYLYNNGVPYSWDRISQIYLALFEKLFKNRYSFET